METFAAALAILGLFSGRPPADLGIHEGRLRGCPKSPNCVSSEAPDDAHRVAAFRIRGEPEEAWGHFVDAVRALPRTEVVSEQAGYLHAESRSRLLGFVDDLELQLRAEEGVVAVRSASRLGYGDLGVNRRRVEALRRALRERGAIE